MTQHGSAGICIKFGCFCAYASSLHGLAIQTLLRAGEKQDNLVQTSIAEQ